MKYLISLFSFCFSVFPIFSSGCGFPGFETCSSGGYDSTVLRGNGGLENSDVSEKATKTSSRLFYGGSVGGAYHFNRHKEGTDLVKTHGVGYYSAYINYQSLESDSSVYDMAFGLPSLEFGFMLGRFRSVSMQGSKADVNYRSYLGNQYTLYYAFRRDMLAGSRLSMGYALENGIGITSRHYNKYNNVDNLFVGSDFSVYFGAGLYGKYRISPHWETILELGFKHYSNSGLDRPNLGSNTLGLQAKINYHPSPILSDSRRLRYHLPLVKTDFYLDCSAGWEGKSLQEEWNYNQSLPADDENYRTAHYSIRTQWNVSLAGMFRYHLKYASGIGLDYSYATYTDNIQQTLDGTNIHGHHPCPHVLGVSLRHEVFYKQVSMAVSLGAYPYRHMGIVNKHLIYETVGLRYYPKQWDRFYLSYNVKAHGMRADGMQLNLGYCILQRKNLY